MNPIQDTLNRYELLHRKCENFDKKKLSSILRQEISVNLENMRIFFSELILKNPNSITNLVKPHSLDLKVWNTLITRVIFFLKIKFENIKNISIFNFLNIDDIIKDIYKVLIEDLRINFYFYKSIYDELTKVEIIKQNNDIRLFISNILNFLGDLKKIKLILYIKKFEPYKQILNISDIDVQSESNEALKFFYFAINNNPKNTRIYSNIGCIIYSYKLVVYREFKKDAKNSVYWFIRALSCVDNDMLKIKDNLEKNFNSIRKEFHKKDYIVEEDIAYLKYDLDFLDLLFYRIQGILYMNIDLDKLDVLTQNFNIIIEKILSNYNQIGDKFKSYFENEGFVEQMIILSILNFHHNLNNLKAYPENFDKINLNNNKEKNDVRFSFSIYSHNILQDESGSKNSYSYCKKFIRDFISIILNNLNRYNIIFAEKFLLVIFYWLSINFEFFNDLFGNNEKAALRYFNYKLQNSPQIITLKSNTEVYNIFIKIIDKCILPIESMFYGFIPLNRFFELNEKLEILNIEDIEENSKINKLVLINFLNMFDLTAQQNDEYEKKFNLGSLKITEKEMKDIQTNLVEKQEITKDIPKMIKVTKIKPKILLDASNIAMRHGDNKVYSTKGIKIAMHYFTKNGHEVLSFLPEYLFRSKEETRRKDRITPDDPNYLKELMKKGLVVQTPPQDYDDDYCIYYAKQNDLFIVTNDLFRDYIEKQKDNRTKEKEKMWIKEKSISFTFHGDEFLPYPSSSFFQNFDISEYSKKAKEG